MRSDSHQSIQQKPQKPQTSPKTLPVVDRLWEVSDEIAEELADAALEAVPEHYRHMLVDLRPASRELVPVTLWHISRGGLPDAGKLDVIRLSAPRNRDKGIPPSVILASIQSSVGKFTSIAIRHSTPADASYLITIMGRAAALTHLYATVYISGTECASYRRPEWWSVSPPWPGGRSSSSPKATPPRGSRRISATVSRRSRTTWGT